MAREKRQTEIDPMMMFQVKTGSPCCLDMHNQIIIGVKRFVFFCYFEGDPCFRRRIIDYFFCLKFGAYATARRMASIMLTGLAMPLPAISRAVP